MGVGDVNDEAARGNGGAARDEAGRGTEVTFATDEVTVVAGLTRVDLLVSAATLPGGAIGGGVQARRVAAGAPPDRLALGRAIGGAEGPGGAVRRALVAGLTEIAHAVAAAREMTRYP